MSVGSGAIFPRGDTSTSGPMASILPARMEDHGECMLVLIGATPEGKKELIGFQVGVRESTQSWRELLVEVRTRGLTIAPQIAVGDGALGFWKALDADLSQHAASAVLGAQDRQTSSTRSRYRCKPT